jgi:integrase
MRRKWQQGRVFQKGRKKSDPWLPTESAYVQFWRDVPGQAELERDFVSLGVCRTRTIAERKAAEKLEELGINSRQTFRESTSNITFKEQGEIWLQSLANRKRNPLEQTTIDTRRYALDKWMYPFFGERYLADVTNLAMKEFVDHISSLAPATIRDYANIVKAVVASARDVKGEPLFMRDWDDGFIDVPEVDEQNQPTVDQDEMEMILREAEEPYCTLYALLAGCGPMRAGEALGLDIRSIHEDFRTLEIVQKAKRGELQDHMKTKNADSRHGRVVDLSEPLAAMLREFVGGRASGLVFCKPDGSQLMQRDILKHSLHPILKKSGLEQGGLNIFRRFRITKLEIAEVPAALQHTWSGHAKSHVSEVYKKLLKQREWRLRWAEKTGTGFTLPRHQQAAAEASNGKPGKLLQFRKVG